MCLLLMCVLLKLPPPSDSCWFPYSCPVHLLTSAHLGCLWITHSLFLSCCLIQLFQPFPHCLFSTPNCLCFGYILSPVWPGLGLYRVKATGLDPATLPVFFCLESATFKTSVHSRPQLGSQLKHCLGVFTLHPSLPITCKLYK